MTHMQPAVDGARKVPGATFDFAAPLSLETARAVISGETRIELAPEIGARCDASHRRLQACIGEARHVYGITTGFGPLANRLVNPDEAVQLQQNLVHHLATGLGEPLDWCRARAVCLARLSSVVQGYSGASPASIAALLALLNSDLAPVVPERGTVGASGDLTPLAHVVLAFQGKGAFIDANGTLLEAARGLERLDIAPLGLGSRDGLALVNGTSAMTGIALQNAIEAHRLAEWAMVTSVALMEVLGGRTEAWSPLLAQIRPHPGQLRATERLWAAVADSERVVRTCLSERKLDVFETEAVPGQDAYTLRCVPQVIGGVLDAIAWHEEIVLTELGSVSDNPVFPADAAGGAIHGGNFMGQHVALASDCLGNAIVVLAGLAERQVARLTDETMNRGLPAFLHGGPAGLNSGFMGAQVTATATLAEMRSTGPASVHSISTNGANQDVVSMGTIASRIARDQIGYGSEILAILALAVTQAMDIAHDADPRPFSASSEALRRRVRALSRRLETDRPLRDDITRVASTIRTTGP